MRIPIVFSTDKNFVMQTGVCISSLIKANAVNESYDIFILVDSDINMSIRKSLLQLVDGTDSFLKFIDMDGYIENAYEVRGITKATYYRLLIPWLIPEYDRIIYSDGDIIFTGQLKEAYLSDINNNYIAGVRSIGVKLYKKQYKYIKSLKLNPNDYINAGFIVINAALMRSNDLMPQFIDKIKNKYLYQDQDILNIVCKNRISYLPIRYNFPPFQYYQAKSINNLSDLQLGINYTEIEQDNISVIHFIGPKPWQAPVFMFMKWWEAYISSPFYNVDYEMSFSLKQIYPKVTIKSIIKQILRYFHIK